MTLTGEEMDVLADMDLLELQAETLFRYDASGRMLCLNQADAAPAPRLFFGRTMHGTIWRFRHDIPDPLAGTLSRLLRSEPMTAELDRPPTVLPALIDALHEYGAVGRFWRGPAWHFPEDLDEPRGAVSISDTNLAVLRRHFPWAIEELEEVKPCAAVTVDGDAVTLCFSARTSLRAAEAGLETVTAYRGRGYAGAAASVWADAIRAANRVPLYSTSWDNLASRRVAGKLHLKMYGADLWID